MKEAIRTNHRTKIEFLINKTNKFAYFYLFQMFFRKAEKSKILFEIDISTINQINLYLLIFINVLLLLLYYQSPNTSQLEYEQNSLGKISLYKDVIQISFCVIRIIMEFYFICLYFYNYFSFEIYEYFDSRSKVGLLIPKLKGADYEENEEKNEIINELKNNLFNEEYIKKFKSSEYYAPYFEILKRIYDDVVFNNREFLVQFLLEEDIP